MSPPCFFTVCLYNMGTFGAEYVLFWTHLILDDCFLSVLKKNLQTQFSLLLSAAAVCKQIMTILRKVLKLCNCTLYVN